MGFLKSVSFEACGLPSMTTTRLLPRYNLVLSIIKILAENGFDPPTSGLWAQHASTAPLCFVVIVTTSIVTVVSRFIVPSYLSALKPGFAHSHLLKMFLRHNSWKLVCTVFKKWHLGHLVTVNGPILLKLSIFATYPLTRCLLDQSFITHPLSNELPSNVKNGLAVRWL